MFLKDLNVFFPYISFLGSVLGKVVYSTVLVTLTLIPGGADHARLAYFVAHLLPAVVVIIIWWRIGLSPRNFKAELHKRFRNGHLVVAVTNFVALCAGLLSLFAIRAGALNGIFLLLPVVPVVLVAWIVGLLMIWTAYAKA